MEAKSMEWQAYFPTRVFFGRGVVQEQAEFMAQLGRRALIVTGQGGSSSRNGALADVCAALEQAAISWDIFNHIEPNPSVETVRKGALRARAMQADFIIGVGGGSPMDAAKAIAITNLAEISEEELFAAHYGEVLPIVLVPTTAGSGSEATQASILTSPHDQTKRNIGSPKLIAKIAYLDSVYTHTLPWQTTADTAVDAYAHAIESHLSRKNNALSSLYSLQALKILGQELTVIARKEELTPDRRETLLFASHLAGVAISLTGTSIPHALGYSLTYFKGIPHGRANGLILPAWLEFNQKMSQDPRIDQAMEASAFANIGQFRELIELLCGPAPIIAREERAIFLQQAGQSKNISNNVVILRPADMEEILDQVGVAPGVNSKYG